VLLTLDLERRGVTAINTQLPGQVSAQRGGGVGFTKSFAMMAKREPRRTPPE